MSAEAVGWCYRHSPFTGSVFAVHLALADSANDQNGHELWMAQGTVATKARVSRQTANSAIRELVDSGLLELLDGDRAGGVNRYRFAFPDAEVVYETRRKHRERVSPETTPLSRETTGGVSPETTGVSPETTGVSPETTHNPKEPKRTQTPPTPPETSPAPAAPDPEGEADRWIREAARRAAANVALPETCTDPDAYRRAVANRLLRENGPKARGWLQRFDLTGDRADILAQALTDGQLPTTARYYTRPDITAAHETASHAEGLP